VTIAYSSPLNLVGPTITETLAHTSLDTTVSSVPSHSKTETTLRHTSSTNMQLTPRQGVDSTDFHHLLRLTTPLRPATPECTPVTFPSSTVETANMSPPHSAISTSIASSVDSLDVTVAPSAQRRSHPVGTLKITSPTSTSSIPQSYTGSNRWRQPHTPFNVPSSPSHMHGRSKHLASTLFQESPSISSSSGFPTKFHRSMPMNTSASANSTIVHSIIKPTLLQQKHPMYVDIHS
jgi:hypothetical protein